MKLEQARWSRESGWAPTPLGRLGSDANLVLIFGGRYLLEDSDRLIEVKSLYPEAQLLGCSTAGEIMGTEVHDDTLSVTAVQFEHTKIRGAIADIREFGDAEQAGRYLAERLAAPDLVHVFVLSDGLSVNGSDLVTGLLNGLPEQVTVTGGLSGDGDRFGRTLVIGDGEPVADNIAAVGFYGDRLRVGFGSLGGWDSFGPERVVTRSEGNILYELDDQSALAIYKQYLGEHASGLPATGLLYPLSVRVGDADPAVVRTILRVDDEKQSITFAGDIPLGSYARFMKANFDRLIDGAVGAARTSYQAIGSLPPDLAILISCVGRKMVLKQRIEEEVEGVREVLGDRAALTGFYSYGEISPFTPTAKCELHNQTMTITTLKEV